MKPFPPSRRPLAAATSPWAASWATVTRYRDRRHSPGTPTSKIAKAAEPSTTALVGAGWGVITRCQTWLKTVTPNMLPANRRRLRARVRKGG